ncbi:MAG TPA: hypothetical protein ENJ08_03960 [Gammaproteobacteria bacterium]|nr:hypothetical protein [Gammaproteobacteria bacterium]
MLALLLKIGVWVVLWVSAWIIFIDYLPTNAHFEYMGAASPFVIITLLLSALLYGSGISTGAYTVIIIPGILFWSVVAFFIYSYRRKKTKSTSKSPPEEPHN